MTFPDDVNDRLTTDGLDLRSTQDYTIEAVNGKKIDLKGDVRINGVNVITEDELDTALEQITFVYDARNNGLLADRPIAASSPAVGTDNTVFINDAITALSDAIATYARDIGGTYPSYLWARPILMLPPGRITVGDLSAITFPNLTIMGSGKDGTLLNHIGTGALFTLGTFAASPGSVYQGTAFGFTLKDLSVSNVTGIFATDGTRTAECIVDNFCGGIIIDNCRINGFQYGLLAQAGSDFSSIKDSEFRWNDVGVYLGPASDQSKIKDSIFMQNRESLVLSGSFTKIDNCWFIDSSEYHIVRESNAATRGGVNVDSIIWDERPITISNCWFEDNSNGTSRIAKSCLFINSTTTNIPRNISISDCIVIAGGTTGAFKRSFIKAAMATRGIIVDKLSINGTLDWVVQREAGETPVVRLIDVKTVDGYTVVPYWGNATTVDTAGWTGAISLFSDTAGVPRTKINVGTTIREVSGHDDSALVREVLNADGTITYGEFVTGAWRDRMKIDIEAGSWTFRPDSSPTVISRDSTTLGLKSDRGFHLTEQADPTAPGVNNAIIYAKDVGGKTQLVTRYATGSVIPITQEGEPVFNVKYYGATGDGVTDDTTAIQAALAQLVNGGILYFPRGRYRITASLNCTSIYNLRIQGEGHAGVPSNANLGSQLYMDATNTPILKVANAVDILNISLIYATQQTIAHTNSIALECNNLAGATVRNVSTWNSHIGFGIPQVAFSPTTYNVIFDSRFENVRSYTASMTHFDLRNFNGGGTNCRFTTLYINGGGSLDFVTPGQSANYGIRIINGSGYEFGSISVDGLIVNERVIDVSAGSNMLTFNTLRTEAVTIAKDNDGWFTFGGSDNIVYVDAIEIKNTRWLPVAVATYVFRTNATRTILEVKALRVNTDCNLGGAGVRRALINSTPDTDSDIKFWSIYDPGTKFSDTLWNDTITTLLQPVTVWNGTIVNEVRRAGRTTGMHRVFYTTAIPTTGTFALDDEIILDGIAVGKPTAYRCITAGTPGTWRPIAWTVKRDTTVNRPVLVASDVGVMFMDNTLDADGKPIWWNGTAWVDATGATV